MNKLQYLNKIQNWFSYMYNIFQSKVSKYYYNFLNLIYMFHQYNFEHMFDLINNIMNCMLNIKLPKYKNNIKMDILCINLNKARKNLTLNNIQFDTVLINKYRLIKKSQNCKIDNRLQHLKSMNSIQFVDIEYIENHIQFKMKHFIYRNLFNNLIHMWQQIITNIRETNNQYIDQLYFHKNNNWLNNFNKCFHILHLL